MKAFRVVLVRLVIMAGSAAFAQEVFVIKKFNNATESTNCQGVFIDRNGKELDAANNKVKSKGTLVVTASNLKVADAPTSMAIKI